MFYVIGSRENYNLLLVKSHVSQMYRTKFNIQVLLNPKIM